MSYNADNLKMPTIQLDEDILHGAGLGVFFRPSEIGKLGITYNQLGQLVGAGVVERVQRGLYRLVSAEPTEHTTVAAVCARVPNAVICLLTALGIYEIGTQLPHQVWIAIHHKARPPRLPQFQTRLVRFSGSAWTYGVRDTVFEGVPARITSPARTIVDCFRYHHLIGREAALEALRDGLRERKVTVDALMRTLEELPSRRLSAALEVGV